MAAATSGPPSRSDDLPPSGPPVCAWLLMRSVFQAAAGTRLAQCFLERWETAVLGRDRRLVVEGHGERPVDTERRIQGVDGDARHPGPPLGVERVEILRRTGVHRLEAVAHAAWHQHLCPF